MLQLDTIPIFCINLEKKPEKFDTIRKRLLTYELNVERWIADTPDTVTYNMVDYLKPGQRACTASHLNLFNHILLNNEEVILILEDDASFRHDWKTIVNEKLKTIDRDDPDWDCLFLNISDEVHPLETWSKIYDQCLSAGYIINKKGIKFILNHFKNLYYCIDWMTQILQSRGHSYSYFPWLIIQENHKSDTRANDKTDENVDYLKVKDVLAKHSYSLDHYDLNIKIIKEPLNMVVLTKNDTVVVLVTYKENEEKAIRTIIDVRTKGKWYLDIVVITIDFHLTDNFKDFYDITEINFPLLNLSDSWVKLHVFDDYFKKWQRVIYLESGLRVLDSLDHLLCLDYKDSFLAPDDGGQAKNKIFKNQIDFNKKEVIDLIKEYGKEIFIKNYFLNAIWVYDTNILNICDKHQLINVMHTYPVFKCNEMGIMNLLLHFKYKLWKPFPLYDKYNKYLFEWSDLNHVNTTWRDYCYLNYPVTITMSNNLN